MGTIDNLEDKLLHAVSSFDVEEVVSCLEKGVDPNCQFHFDIVVAGAKYQPSTPLRMVVFRISDNSLIDDDLRKFAKIARLLINKGADPAPAMELAETRYGKYDPNREPSPFMDVWNIIAGA